MTLEVIGMQVCEKELKSGCIWLPDVEPLTIIAQWLLNFSGKQCPQGLVSTGIAIMTSEFLISRSEV